VDEFGERGQQRTVHGLGREIATDPLGIAGADGLIARSSGVHEGVFDHAEHRTARV
jgi:hypothetical protein